MSLTMFGKISTKNGAVEQSNFHDYQMTRMIDAPNIHVHLVDNDEDPTGVGEPEYRQFQLLLPMLFLMLQGNE